MAESAIPLVAIVGPTGVGKSALAVELARSFSIEVVNGDSRQVYQGMEIGTAKPSAEMRATVPHHLLDVAGPREEFSLATFLDLARQAIADIHHRNKLPMLVGGTGQYVWGLLESWQLPRVPPDWELRQRLEAEAKETGPHALYRRLEELDPVAARQIGPTNVRRLVRALEVSIRTGIPISKQRGKGETPYASLVIGLTMSRKALYQRLDARIEAMLASGWVAEVRRLLDQGCSPDLPSMSSVGYRELAQCLLGKMTWEEVLPRVKAANHRLARHQYAWFRLSDPRIHWLEAGEEALPKAIALVRAHMLQSASAKATQLQNT